MPNMLDAGKATGRRQLAAQALRRAIAARRESQRAALSQAISEYGDVAPDGVLREARHVLNRLKEQEAESRAKAQQVRDWRILQKAQYAAAAASAAADGHRATAEAAAAAAAARAAGADAAPPASAERTALAVAIAKAEAAKAEAVKAEAEAALRRLQFPSPTRSRGAERLKSCLKKPGTMDPVAPSSPPALAPTPLAPPPPPSPSGLRRMYSRADWLPRKPPLLPPPPSASGSGGKFYRGDRVPRKPALPRAARCHPGRSRVKVRSEVRSMTLERSSSSTKPAWRPAGSRSPSHSAERARSQSPADAERAWHREQAEFRRARLTELAAEAAADEPEVALSARSRSHSPEGSRAWQGEQRDFQRKRLARLKAEKARKRAHEARWRDNIDRGLPACDPPTHSQATIAHPPAPWALLLAGGPASPLDPAETIYRHRLTGAVRRGPWVSMHLDPKNFRSTPYALHLGSGRTQWLPPPGWMSNWVSRPGSKARSTALVDCAMLPVGEARLSVSGGAPWPGASADGCEVGAPPWPRTSDDTPASYPADELVKDHAILCAHIRAKLIHRRDRPRVKRSAQDSGFIADAFIALGNSFLFAGPSGQVCLPVLLPSSCPCAPCLQTPSHLTYGCTVLFRTRSTARAIATIPTMGSMHTCPNWRRWYGRGEGTTSEAAMCKLSRRTGLRR